jgi:hypothetical protein
MMSLIFRNETKRLAEAQAATGQVRARLPPQTSNRSRRSEPESSRSSPSVPRGAPQCLHLICVEGGAPSGQSRTMPRESQLMQTILKRECRIGACVTCAAFEIVMTCSKPRLETKDPAQNKAARRNMIVGRLCHAERGHWAMCGSLTLARPRALAMKVAR